MECYSLKILGFERLIATMRCSGFSGKIPNLP